MPELNLRIFSRNYRLAVTPGEEPVLEQCAQRVDQHMEAIRSGGRVVALDQIAVLAALEIAYDDTKTQSTLEARVAELEERAAQTKAVAPEPELPLDLPEEEVAAPAVPETPSQPEELQGTLPVDEPVEKPVAPPAVSATTATADTTVWEKEIDDLCRLCEEAIYAAPARASGFF
jgi:cell division protein ZapA (FtsZ GTPase activity inhibitor)